MRRFFDPQRYRLVLFDQRGCGRSTPHASLQDNTTWDLVDDIERIRESLGIDRFVVFGGSWGSTLALAYAVRHPKRVAALILRGIFLIRKEEVDWFYQRGASEVFPDAFENFLAPIPENERGDLLTAYYRRLTGANRTERLTAARAWSQWEGDALSLAGPSARPQRFNEDPFVEAFARIECHYFINRGFFPRDGWLLEQADRFKHIPGVIVHGRYDLVCPLANAWALRKVWPKAEFEIIPDAGHSSLEPGIVDALVRATDRFARQSGRG
jgi:proline iminopeptidase